MYEGKIYWTEDKILSKEASNTQTNDVVVSETGDTDVGADAPKWGQSEVPHAAAESDGEAGRDCGPALQGMASK